MTDSVCSCGNWFGNHDPDCPVATTIHAIWTVSFSPDKAGSPPEWNRAIEAILVDNAHRVAAALTRKEHLMSDQQWTVNEDGPESNLVYRADGAELIVYAEPGTDEAGDAALARRVAAALNGTPDGRWTLVQIPVGPDNVPIPEYLCDGKPTAPEVILAALNGTADLTAVDDELHNPEGALSFLRYGIDGTPDQRVRDAAYETVKEALRRWRSIDLTEVSAAVSEYLRAITPGIEASEARTALYAVLDAVRALVASTGTETDDAQ